MKNPEKQDRRTGSGMMVTAVLLPLLTVLLSPLTSLQLAWFCAPAAHITAWFLGAPIALIDNAYVLEMARPIEVTTDCSAIKFFALALAVFAGLAVERRWPLRGFAALIPLTYLVTLFANACRIISTWYIDSLVAPVLSKSLQAGFHGVTGALIFMSLLAALYITLGKVSHEHGNKTTAA